MERNVLTCLWCGKDIMPLHSTQGVIDIIIKLNVCVVPCRIKALKPDKIQTCNQFGTRSLK